MGTDQHLILARQKLAHRVDLGFRHARLVHPRRIAQIPLWRDPPVQKKPDSRKGSSAKLLPIERSGTTMIACRTLWLCNLSSAMNISARDLPDAGGDLINKYCSPRRVHARACISRMPSSSARDDAPVRAVVIETEGRDCVMSFA
jgi:hypothetical protein